MLNYFLALLLFTAFSTAREQLSCQYEYGPWSQCVGGNQNRSVACLCDDTNQSEDDLTNCLMQGDLTPEPLSQVCEEEDEEVEEDLNCRWRWTRWAPCSVRCGGGETNRSQVCYCESNEQVMDNEYCEIEEYYGQEVADCNTFNCDDVPARNKLYWIDRASEGQWPMPDDRFACSLGYDTNATFTPVGKHYSTILSMSVDSQTIPHPEWYYLAKEWITTKLNIADRVQFPASIFSIINETALLLEQCSGWSTKDLYRVYAAKEKLGRVNNNIGGLDNVEDQIIYILGPKENNGVEENNSHSVIIFLSIPILCLLLIGIILGLLVYYVRKKRNSVIERAVFEESEDEGTEDEEEEDDDTKQYQTLDQQSTSPNARRGNDNNNREGGATMGREEGQGEKFDSEEDTSDVE